MAKKRKYRNYKKKRSLINRAFESFLNWLDHLKPRTRVRVAWGCVILLFVLIFGVYKGSVAAYHYAVAVIHGDWNPFASKSETEYSNASLNHYDFPIPENKKHPKRRPNYGADFNYVNDVQLKAARKLGITPPETREDIEKMKGKLIRLSDNKYYAILELTNSSPYLVPKAADFLTALGRLMQEYNGTNSRFYISSVLRSQEDVKKLGRRNGNATEKSTHSYGTTVDITYSRFDVKGKTTEAILKEDLARALFDLQALGYCYVKYERKQPCFHITVRP